jgi:hypothetical protein
MNRVIAATVFTFLVSILPGVGQKWESDIIDWNKRPEWNELSLKNESDSSRVYREFLWTPFWGQAMARLTIGSDGGGELVTKVRDYEEPHSITTTSQVLNSGQVNIFLSALDRAHFWSLASTEQQNPRPRDADSCTLEAANVGNYHAVRRTSQPRSEFTRACEYFVRAALVKAARPDR